ncbi:MAG: exodeoxyribonuclease VII large subunit, partial [Phycisphaeraceae bacterium]|nr:exodeoxyribonuclease VII large subunit [Phycisphaeraceae bacterium]
MPRLFDEQEPPSGAKKGDSKAGRPMSVGSLLSQIKSAVNTQLPGKVRVVGELSNLSDRNHWFFSLKDGEAVIRCVMFASAARAVGFKARDGAEVVATGRVDVYPAQGSVQLYVDKLEQVGQGALEQRLRELINELKGEGYFDPEHKRPLPTMPTRIAVVTSRSAAALQDVINTAAKRWAGCELVLVDVRVQGDAAASQIADAINRLSTHGRDLGIDAILLTRGGGSIEDLWAFNERVVADAIWDCNLPVVAAIGHETDVTVAELVADERCATPTQAAMTLVPDKVMLQQQVDQSADRLTLALKRRAQHERQRLRGAERHPAMSRPERLVVQAGQSLDRLTRRLDRALPAVVASHAPKLETLSRALPQAMTRRVSREREALEALARELDAVGPASVLGRGYTYTLGPDGDLLRSAEA